jgi:RNA polymerase sigma factor (sigma-70 family)
VHRGHQALIACAVEQARALDAPLVALTFEPHPRQFFVADTFTRALSAWSGGHGPTGRPLPWLLVICRRIATDRWRRRRLIGWVPLFVDRPDHGDVVDLELGSSDDAIEVREFWIWLDTLTRTIPTRQRELLFLRYERDLTDDEIGEILGLTASGVRSLSTRSIESLRRHPELLK